MRENINKVQERGERLDSLQDKTGEFRRPRRRRRERETNVPVSHRLNADTDSAPVDNLALSAQSFRKGANRVRKQMWYVSFRFVLLIELTDLAGGRTCE